MSISQPKNLQERIEIARRFGVDFNLSEVPLLVDDPATESFEKSFAPWPLRFYILGNGKVVNERF